MKKSWNGGVFPAAKDTKSASLVGAIEPFNPECVILPLRGCSAAVKKGDRVKMGQVIGVPEGPALAVHASVSGEVTEISPRATVWEDDTICAIIRNDFKYEEHSEKICTKAPGELEPQEIVQLMRDAALAGMGGAEFPAYRKYQSAQNIQSVLINACECEPFLTCDYVLMRDHAALIEQGAQLMARAAGAKAVLCTEENKRGLLDRFHDIETAVFPTIYPQGSERQLITAYSGMEVPNGGFPASCGYIVSNAATAAALAQAAETGLPVLSRIVTVTGNVKSPHNLRVPLGTPFGSLIDACGGLKSGGVILSGGPMTGREVKSLAVPVTKGVSGIVALRAPEVSPSACIRCGGCVRACPSNLTPFRIEEEFSHKRFDVYVSLHAEQCIRCGCCSFICPAKRELTQSVSQARDMILSGGRMKK